MTYEASPVRVLYSFPHKIGADRICHTAWQQVSGLAAAGAQVLAFPGVLHRPLPSNVRVHPTLARGKFRIPYKLLGTIRACILHDWIVARRIKELAGQIDIIHVWPLGALRTLRTAHKLGIPTVLERPNAHTRFAYTVVQRECKRIGVMLPTGHEHAYHEDILKREEAEYALATRLLCPSDFVLKSFMEHGFSHDSLIRHIYGFDEKRFFPDSERSDTGRGLTILFAGGCAPRKGLHFALDAWLRSSAHREGSFLVAGRFVPGYAQRLAAQLSHPSVTLLGYRNDVAELMRRSDVLVLPSIEEGSALVTSEARGCGCVLLVSHAAGATCEHMVDSLVHRAGDVAALAKHFDMLHEDRQLLSTLRENSLKTAHEITWSAAAKALLSAYRKTLASHRHRV